VNVNSPVAVWHAPTPHPSINVLTGHDAIGPQRKRGKDFELAHCQRGALSACQSFAVIEAKFERSKDDLIAFGGVRSYRSCIHPRELTPTPTAFRERPVTQW